MPIWNTNNPFIFAHRGASADAPENTMPAFSLADQQQADGIEFDIQMSADGVPMVMHDGTVDRTTDGTGSVGQMTAAELQRLNAGNSLYPAPIPTLEEVLVTFKERFLFNIEIKGEGWADRGTERKIWELIDKHGVAEQVVMSSFGFWSVVRCRQVMPAFVRVAYLHELENNMHQFVHSVLDLQADHPYACNIDATYMAWANANELMVNTWTVDDPTLAQKLIDLGVKTIITNKPAYLRQQLGM
jgi:glycerophosphoryl diester phosphodiesterase